MEHNNKSKQELHKLITERVFITNSEQQIAFHTDMDAWIFDFRTILMDGHAGNLIAKLFCQEFKNESSFQIGTIEIAGVPLMSSLVRHMYDTGNHDISGFFVRKSRKKSGLLRMIEGHVKPGVPIILVDDLMNAGGSFWRQVEALEELGHPVKAVWSVLRFRNQDFYERFHRRGIAIHSVFELNDFTTHCGDHIKNLTLQDSPKPVMPFSAIWAFGAERPSLMHVVPKSQPIIDDDSIYFGTDNRKFYCLNQEDGSVRWSYQVGRHTQHKSIFSNPIFYKDQILFGSYDGNLYCLSKATGKPIWINYTADFIGSSPAIAADLGLVFIGQEFGFRTRLGGISAHDIQTGKLVWSDTHPAFTHATPTYIKKYRQVVIGSNDGRIRLYDAKRGTKLWEFTCFGGAEYDALSNGGFSPGDIKESCVYDDTHDWIIVGSIDGFLYIIDRKTGYLVFHYKCEFAVWSAPVIYKDRAYFTSLDKHIRCLDLNTKELLFEQRVDGARIFSGPAIINDRLYIGTNAARLHELDTETGDCLGYFQAVERITNQLVYNPKNDRYFLPTYANQIICLERTKAE